jgi:hypothetical protein
MIQTREIRPVGFGSRLVQAAARWLDPLDRIGLLLALSGVVNSSASPLRKIAV